MRRPGCLGGAGAFLVCFVALFWWTTRDSYGRYTSSPLPDGTRYTFLYPTHMRVVAHATGEVSLQDAPQPRLLSGLQDMRRRLFGSGRGGSVSNLIAVGVFPLSEGPPFTTRDREEKSGPLWHDIHLADRRHARSFTMHHWGYRGSESQFARETAVVSQSFKLLPPGTKSED